MKKSKHNKKPIQEKLQEQEEILKRREERDRRNKYNRERQRAQTELFPQPFPDAMDYLNPNTE